LRGGVTDAHQGYASVRSFFLEWQR